ncbi:hypothetical protein ACLB2K_072048 [Fragaria x ananassa]
MGVLVMKLILVLFSLSHANDAMFVCCLSSSSMQGRNLQRTASPKGDNSEAEVSSVGGIHISVEISVHSHATRNHAKEIEGEEVASLQWCAPAFVIGGKKKALPFSHEWMLPINWLHRNHLKHAMLLGVSVSESRFIREVPNVQNLHNLEIFFVDENNLGSGKDDLSFVSDLINATELTQLHFGNNNFGGTLPTSISNLSTNLQKLLLLENQLHGSIPTGLGNLVNLELLDMGGNSFTGTIPSDIGKLSNLGVMYLEGNELSGSIPSSLTNPSLPAKE